MYDRALRNELRIRGLRAVSQAAFSVMYKGQCVGEYSADILVEDTVIVELKCVEHLANEHMAQCLNYLRSSGKKLCLLVNFQKPRIEWKTHRALLAPAQRM